MVAGVFCVYGCDMMASGYGRGTSTYQADTIVIGPDMTASSDLPWVDIPEPCQPKTEDGPRFSDPHQTRPSRRKNKSPHAAARRHRRKELAKRTQKEQRMAAKNPAQLVIVDAADAQALYREGRLVRVARVITDDHVKKAGGRVLMTMPTPAQWIRHKFPQELLDVPVAIAEVPDGRGSRQPAADRRPGRPGRQVR